MRATIKFKGPGRGWWGPPKGTHAGEGGPKAYRRVVAWPKKGGGKRVSQNRSDAPKGGSLAANSGMIDVDGNIEKLPTSEVVKLNALLEQQPPQTRNSEKVASILIAKDDKAFAEAFFEAGGFSTEAAGTTAFYDPSANQMVFRKDYAAYTFHHEYGHGVWEMTSEKARTGWKSRYKDPKFDRHTDYSIGGGVEEAFSEAYASYINTEGVAYLPGFSSTYGAVKEVLDAIR